GAGQSGGDAHEQDERGCTQAGHPGKLAHADRPTRAPSPVRSALSQKSLRDFRERVRTQLQRRGRKGESTPSSRVLRTACSWPSAWKLSSSRRLRICASL